MSTRRPDPRTLMLGFASLTIAAAVLALTACTGPEPGPEACGVKAIDGHINPREIAGRYVGDNFGTLTLTDPGNGLDKRDEDNPDSMDGLTVGKVRYTDWRKNIHGRWKTSGKLDGTGKWWITRQDNDLDTLTIMYKHKPDALTTHYQPLFLTGSATKPRLTVGIGDRYPDKCDMNTLRRVSNGAAGLPRTRAASSS